MVMDVWQASLMRAFAAQLQREQEGEAPNEGGDEWRGDGGGSDEEEGWEDEEPAADEEQE